MKLIHSSLFNPYLIPELILTWGNSTFSHFIPMKISQRLNLFSKVKVQWHYNWTLDNIQHRLSQWVVNQRYRQQLTFTPKSVSGRKENSLDISLAKNVKGLFVSPVCMALWLLLPIHYQSSGHCSTLIGCV